MSDAQSLSLSDAEALIHSALGSAGVGDAVAASVARALVAAEAEGQVGHGFSRLGDYAAQVRSGKINPRAEVRVTRRGPASVLIDADRGFAYPALDAAIAHGAPLARRMGVAVMAVTNSHHCGALSVQVERLAREGLVGMMVANTPKAIAPWGAKEPLYGTNPIAFAAPAGEGEAPLVIDLSLSRVARGKVMTAKSSGLPISEGWALDADGAPTTDPEAALAGTMVPIGEAKGAALALMVEVLASCFTGSAFSRDAGSFFDAQGPAPRVGQTLIAIAPDPASGFAGRVAELMRLIEASEGARVPGARRRAALERAEREGVSVASHHLKLARELADDR
ncbi:MAG: Ldh family oxidoreductase [Pseudomonadota bacterium]